MRRFLHMCLIFSAFGAVPALSEGPAPWPEFTFKRVGVPQPGQSGPRITVQVDPTVPAPEPAVAPSKEPSPPESHGWEWFWTTVQTERAQGGPENMARAMAALDGREALPQPRLQHLQDIAAAHGTEILRATAGTDVSPALVVAVIAVESAGRVDAQSGAGAQGLMQLIPDTAARFGVADASDPAQNISGGVKYLAWLLGHFDRDVILALAGYNAGENAVGQYSGVPPYPETRAYVPKVLAAWQVARGLCLTRPELISDGCVFAVREASNG